MEFLGQTGRDKNPLKTPEDEQTAWSRHEALVQALDGGVQTGLIEVRLRARAEVVGRAFNRGEHVVRIVEGRNECPFVLVENGSSIGGRPSRMTDLSRQVVDNASLPGPRAPQNEDDATRVDCVMALES